MSFISVVVELILVLFLVLIIKSYLFSRQQVAPYPPGPPSKPLIGNIFDFPAANAASEFQVWGKKYHSDIIHATALGSHIIILNKFIDADELLEKRAANYSDRPVFPIVNLMGWDYNMSLLSYGSKWRLHRRISQEYIGPPALKVTRPVIISKVRDFLEGLLYSPEKLFYHNKMLSVSIPMKTMYGYDVESIEDPFIAKAEKSTVEGAKLIAPGGSLVNVIPILRYIPPWFPKASSHKIAAEVKNLVYEMQNMTMEFVEQRVSEGKAFPSLVSNFIEKKNTIDASHEAEAAVKNVALTVYSGASDTTVASTVTFFYLMVLHPEVQKKAQVELDQVLGSARLPCFKDRASLPYVEAIYREVLRWCPTAALGIPHAIVDDDYYKGYLFPKGATIYANIWAMTHDETVYAEPFTFRPERFIDENGKINHDDRVLTYGFGRRICAGKHVASATVWYTMACVLACFVTGKAKDEHGNDIEPDDKFDNRGLITHKEPFKCSITPRSAAWRKLIEDFKVGN